MTDSTPATKEVEPFKITYRFIFPSVVFAWLAFLGLGHGHRFDEAEHAHAAWLMVVQNLEPIRDFFQHHQPLLWVGVDLGRAHLSATFPQAPLRSRTVGFPKSRF